MANQNQLFDLGQQSMLRIIRSARSKLGRDHSVDAGGERLSRRPSSGRSSLSMGRYRAARSRSSLDGNSENAAPTVTGNSEKPLQQNTTLGRDIKPTQAAALGAALADATNRTLASVHLATDKMAADNQTKVDNQKKATLAAPTMPVLPADGQSKLVLGAPTLLQRTQTERLPAPLEELRRDPVLGGRAVNYAGMCRGLADQGLSEAQLKAHWANLTLADTAVDYAQLESDAHLVLAENPQQVFEYVPDILQVLQRVEMLDAPSPCYLDLQAHVNEKMRGILVDWLVSVQQKYKLKDETVFLAVSLIDRYLALKATARQRLQLVGVTALLIAAKFEEIYPPHVNDMVTVTDRAYTRQDIINMEVTMLGALDFKICRPTPMQFFERYQAANCCSETHRDLALYILELALVDYNMIKYSPSHLAAATVLLSNKLLRRRPSWPTALAEDTHFTELILKECAKQMCMLLENAEQSSLQAVRKKFAQTKYHAVSKIAFTG